MEPCRKRGPGRPPGGGGPAPVPSDAELQRVLTSIGGIHALRNRAIFYLQFATGLRVGEIATLTVADLIAAGQLRRSFKLRKDHCKYGQAREVFLENSAARAALTTYYDERRRDADPTAPFFLGQRGPLRPNGLAKLFGQIYREAGVPGASSHSGRRWYGTRLKSRGVDMRTIQLLLGHSSLRTTQIYLDVTPDDLVQAAQRIEIPGPLAPKERILARQDAKGPRGNSRNSSVPGQFTRRLSLSPS